MFVKPLNIILSVAEWWINDCHFTPLTSLTGIRDRPQGGSLFYYFFSEGGDGVELKMKKLKVEKP